MNRPGQEESARRFDPSTALSFGNHPHDLHRSVHGRSRGRVRTRAHRPAGGRAHHRRPRPPARPRGRDHDHVRHAARGHGRRLRRQRCRRALAVEGRLRCLRNRAAPLPARLRPCPAPRQAGHAADHAAAACRAVADPHQALGREPGPAAAVDAAADRACRRLRRRADGSRHGAGTVRRHRPARHPCRARRRAPDPQRAFRSSRRAPAQDLPRRSRQPARRRPYP